MNDVKGKLGWFVLLPAFAASLGWGIRGMIGPALIPGAFAGSVLCILLAGKRFSPGLVIGLTGLGFCYGTDETTLQTAGFVMGTNHNVAANYALGYTGLALKGGLWALFGGAGLGLALAAYRYRKRDIVIGALLLVAAFYAGCWAINKPKLVYFSVDRREIWGGLLVGAIMLLAWASICGRTRVPLVIALSAAAAGAVGYPIAVTLATLGGHSGYSGPWSHWWKLAEFTFGAFIGAGLGLGTYIILDKLPEAEGSEQPAATPGLLIWGVMGGAVMSALCVAAHSKGVPWILLASLLLCVAFYSLRAAWQFGITLTYCASASAVSLYFLHGLIWVNAPVVAWTLTAASTLAVAWMAESWSAKNSPAVARQAFVLLIWAMLALSYFRNFANRAILAVQAQGAAAASGWWRYEKHVSRDGWRYVLVFAVATVALTWLVARIEVLTKPPSPPQPSAPDAP